MTTKATGAAKYWNRLEAPPWVGLTEFAAREAVS